MTGWPPVGMDFFFELSDRVMVSGVRGATSESGWVLMGGDVARNLCLVGKKQQLMESVDQRWTGKGVLVE